MLEKWGKASRERTPSKVSYRKEIVVVARATLRRCLITAFLITRLIDFILGGFLLGVSPPWECLVFAVTKLLDKHILPLPADNELAVYDFFDEASLIFELSVIRMVNSKPMFLDFVSSSSSLMETLIRTLRLSYMASRWT